MLTIAQQNGLLDLLRKNFSSDLSAYKPLFLLNQNIGFMNEKWEKLLARDLGKACTVLPDRIIVEEQDSLVLADALQNIGKQWHKTGELSGWRNELFDVKNHDEQVLFQLERALFRPFGLLSHSVHINGLYQQDDQTLFWIGTRSPFKAVDPNKLDNLVGGGIITGENIIEAMQREAEEEAGVPANLLTPSHESSTCLSLRHISRGLHREYLHVFNVVLPTSFSPQNQDGEVAQFNLYTVEQVINHMLDGRFMNDALLATVFAFEALQLIDPSHELSSYLDKIRIKTSSS